MYVRWKGIFPTVNTCKDHRQHTSSSRIRRWQSAFKKLQDRIVGRRTAGGCYLPFRCCCLIRSPEKDASGKSLPDSRRVTGFGQRPRQRSSALPAFPAMPTTRASPKGSRFNRRIAAHFHFLRTGQPEGGPERRAGIRGRRRTPKAGRPLLFLRAAWMQFARRAGLFCLERF